jgi:hypothetical protein
MAKDKNGYTALHSAALDGHEATVQPENRPNVKAKDKNESTILSVPGSAQWVRGDGAAAT